MPGKIALEISVPTRSRSIRVTGPGAENDSVVGNAHETFVLESIFGVRFHPRNQVAESLRCWRFQAAEVQVRPVASSDRLWGNGIENVSSKVQRDGSDSRSGRDLHDGIMRY